MKPAEINADAPTCINVITLGYNESETLLSVARMEEVAGREFCCFVKRCPHVAKVGGM